MPTVRLNNGNIDADGSLSALSITTRDVSTETLNVAGQLTASSSISANVLKGNLKVENTANVGILTVNNASISAINGLVDINGDVTAGQITASGITGLVTINGNLSLSGSITTDNVYAQNISAVKTLQAEDVKVGGDLLVSGAIESPSVSVMGDLTASTLVASTLNGPTRVNGSMQANSLTVSSSVEALAIDCETLKANNTVITSGMQAAIANISDTLTIGGDLIIEGDDDKVLGNTITDVTGIGPLTLNIRHNHWYRTGYVSHISILADTDSGRIKTCYIISSPANPLVMNGVQWLWEPVELEDTSKTHVIALQQIGAGPVMANVAYSY